MNRILFFRSADLPVDDARQTGTGFLGKPLFFELELINRDGLDWSARDSTAEYLAMQGRDRRANRNCLDGAARSTGNKIPILAFFVMVLNPQKVP